MKKRSRLCRALLNSPEGKALLRLLTQGDGGAALERAAQNASHGSTAELTALLNGVLAHFDSSDFLLLLLILFLRREDADEEVLLALGLLLIL